LHHGTSEPFLFHPGFQRVNSIKIFGIRPPAEDSLSPITLTIDVKKVNFEHKNVKTRFYEKNVNVINV